MALEFKVGERTYRSGKLDAFGQLHVARKLAPLLTKVAPSAPTNDADATMMQLLAPISEALAAMSEEDVNYVLHRCLSVVSRLQGQDVWAPVWNDRGKKLMFDDIDLAEMLNISMQVLGDNLGNFMRGGALSSSQLSPQGTDGPVNLSPFPTAKTG